MSDEKPSLPEVARAVVVNFGAGLAAYGGPMAGAAAQGAVPAVLAGMDMISATIGKRRIEHATETMTDAAEEFGAETPEEFIEFLNAALSDEEHQELLSRALTIAQDAAMRDKRRALGRALAAAASDTGTKVDNELMFIRALAELDAPHIRCLRLVSQPSDPNIKGLNAYTIGFTDWGLGPLAIQLLHDLERLGLAEPVEYDEPRDPRLPPIKQYSIRYVITDQGRLLLHRLEEPGATD